LSKETFYSAVDIGSSKVFSVVARIGAEGELKVLGTGLVPSQGVQKGQIENIEEVRVAARDSLEEAQRYLGRGIVSGVYSGVSGSHITCLNTKDVLDNPSDEDGLDSTQVERLLQSAAPRTDPGQEILHMIPIGYGVDGLTSVRNPSGLHARQVQVESHVVMGDSATLMNTVKAVQSNRVNVRSLVLSSLASAESTLTADEKEMGSILVDIGGGTTDLVIYRQGNPWYSSVIPVGGNQLTRDLAVAMRIPYYLAEEIKIKWGNALPEMIKPDEEVVVPGFQGQPRRVVKRRSLCEPLQERTMEMLKMILLRVRQAGLRQIPTGGLVITGGCAELQGLRQLTLDTTGGPVRIAHPMGISGLPTQLQKPNASAAVGLLLWGIKHQGQKRRYGHNERNQGGKRSLRDLLMGRKKEEQRVPVG
jgi:cell division protein FtsA